MWHVSGDPDSGSAQRSSDALLQALRDINESHQLLDAMTRTLEGLRRELFAAWWLVVSDSADNDKAHFGKVDGLVGRIGVLEAQHKVLKAEVAKVRDEQGKGAVQPGARPSGWEPDYLDPLRIRLESQTVDAPPEKKPKTKPKTKAKALDEPPASEPPAWDGLEKTVRNLPDDIQSPVRRLMAEFIALRPEASKSPDLTSPIEMPVFHDRMVVGRKAPGQKDDTPKTAQPLRDDPKQEPYPPTPPPKPELGPWRDRWNDSQPWFPLFLEWGVTYFHIPFEHWTLEQRGSLTHKVPQLRYGIPCTTNLEKEAGGAKADTHTIQGRVLVLPQPSFSLAAKIDQLFSSTPASDLQDPKEGGSFPLTRDEREKLQAGLHRLALLSAPLAGLSSHLTTLLQGTHIKPILRDPIRGTLTPVNEATRVDAGFTSTALGLIGIETDSTPFGNLFRAPTAEEESLFKPATHGQFRFTRLNIIDKFGQAIHAIDPTPMLNPSRVWPIIGEWYAPQLKDDPEDPRKPPGKVPNIVEPAKRNNEVDEVDEVGEADDEDEEDDDKDQVSCEFVQIPPQIN
ncbi:hypothetical protein BKA56DRAFT_606743 [Ilyonectria sp. MPI-CAGE-AT-0026]|nr:hypothetical protein BKA56DRAFT_606743 [Ilyonectria sp. MPI-CAGE-AT-0026]